MSSRKSFVLRLAKHKVWLVVPLAILVIVALLSSSLNRQLNNQSTVSQANVDNLVISDSQPTTVPGAITAEGCTEMIFPKGPMYSPKGYAELVDFYLKFNPVNVCVIYCSGDDDMEQIDKIKSEYPTRFYHLMTPYPGLNEGSGHRNIQKFYVAKAHEFIKRELPNVQWVMHIRSDQIVRLPGVTNVLKSMVLADPLSDARGNGPQKHRLVSSSRATFDVTAGWAHLDDHFMFGHLDDMILYWGFNQYWNLKESFSRFVQKCETGWRYGADPYGMLTGETEFAQIYLRMLGSDFEYHNLRTLFSERWILVRSNVILFDMWAHHESVFSTGIERQDVRSECTEKGGFAGKNRMGHESRCIDWETTQWAFYEGGYVMDVCKIRAFDYDCSIDTSPNATYSGEYEGNDFYALSEPWV